MYKKECFNYQSTKEGSEFLVLTSRNSQQVLLLY